MIDLKATVVVACFFACAVGLTALFFGCNKTKELRGAERMRVISDNYYRYNEKLKTGMLKMQVGDLLGSPDNLDTTTVWVYSEGGNGRWKDMVLGKSVLFIVFYNDKLITSGFVKSAAENPWEAMSRCRSISDEKIVELLGQKPKALE